MKFRDSPSQGSRVIACGQMNVTNRVVAVRRENEPENVIDICL